MLKDVTYLQENPLNSRYSITRCRKPPECDLRAKRQGRSRGREGWLMSGALSAVGNCQDEGSQLGTALLPHQGPVNVQHLHYGGKNFKETVADWKLFKAWVIRNRENNSSQACLALTYWDMGNGFSVNSV